MLQIKGIRPPLIVVRVGFQRLKQHLASGRPFLATVAVIVIESRSALLDYTQEIQKMLIRTRRNVVMA